MGAVVIWFATFFSVMALIAATLGVGYVIDYAGTKLGPFAGLVAFFTIIAAMCATNRRGSR